MMRQIVGGIFSIMILWSLSNEQKVKIIVYDKSMKKIENFSLFYKETNSKIFKKYFFKNDFLNSRSGLFDLKLVVGKKSYSFKEIESVYLKDFVRLQFNISNPQKSNCVFYYNLSVHNIGNRKLNLEDCGNILSVIGPLNDE
jgi:Fe-S cluster assembly iron-binding protein IscA